MKNRLKLALITLLSAVALCGCFIGCQLDRRNDGSTAGGSTDTSIGDNENNNGDNNDKTDEPTEPQKPIATEGLEYEKVKENDRVVGYRVSGIGTAKDTEIIIPDEYEDKPVISIGAKAFEDCYKITKITLPDTITDIQEDAFSGCEKLDFSDYGNAIYLGTADNAYYAVIEAVNTAISSVTIHAQTKVSAKNAFMSCKNLDNVNYNGKSVAEWCEIDFSGDFANPLSMQAYLNINGKRIDNLVIPNTVTSIKKYAFNRMIVKSIKIPSSVTDIGYAAFFLVCGLTSDLVIPSGVTYVDEHAFASMDGEYDIKINADEIVLNEYAFSHCNGVGALTISGESVKIGSKAFVGCSATSLTVTGGYVGVGSSAFEYSDLTSVSFKNSGTDLDGFAFGSCSNLTYVEFECLYSIGMSVFSGSRKLTDMYYGGTKSDWESVDKKYNWLSVGQVLTVHCSDGNVTAK